MGDETSAASGPTGTYPGFGGRVGRTFAGVGGVVARPRRRPGRRARTSSSCWSTTSASPTSAATAARSPRPTSTPSPPRGLQFTNFHVTPMCSPTRAALLTGLNPHDAGVGTVAHSDPGFPGYADGARRRRRHRSPRSSATNGYATLHGRQVAPHQGLRPVRRRARGTRGRASAASTASTASSTRFTNLHHPHRLVEDNHPVEVDHYPDGYYFTDDLTDRAIAMIRERKASNPDEAVLPLLRARRGARAAARQGRRHRQVPRPLRRRAGTRSASAATAASCELGVARGRHRAGAPQHRARTTTCRPWDDLPDREQELFARYMEVFAAMVDNVDQNVGRLLDALEAMGELDNTIVIFTSDNGASREGEVVGTTAYCVAPPRRATTSTPTSPASTSSAARRPRRTTRGAGPWRATRRSASTRSTPTPAATRCRS